MKAVGVEKKALSPLIHIPWEVVNTHDTSSLVDPCILVDLEAQWVWGFIIFFLHCVKVDEKSSIMLINRVEVSRDLKMSSFLLVFMWSPFCWILARFLILLILIKFWIIFGWLRWCLGVFVCRGFLDHFGSLRLSILARYIPLNWFIWPRFLMITFLLAIILWQFHVDVLTVN